MVDFSSVISFDGRRCIVQRCKEILPDILDLGRILRKAGHHINDVRVIEFQKFASHNLCREERAGDQYLFRPAQQRLQNEFNDSLKKFCSLRESQEQIIKLDVLTDQCSVFRNQR